jgi:hypothetical protein
MNRREFLQHTVAGGAMSALGVSMSPSASARAVNWPIGCFNRPWTTWSFDDALRQIKAAGYQTMGLLSRTKSEPFIGADATPEYLTSLKARIAASGLKANMGALRTRHNIQRARRKRPMHIMVVVQCQHHLLEVVTAMNPPGCFAGLLDGRQQQSHQNRNDGDHHQ